MKKQFIGGSLAIARNALAALLLLSSTQVQAQSRDPAQDEYRSAATPSITDPRQAPARVPGTGAYQSNQQNQQYQQYLQGQQQQQDGVPARSRPPVRLPNPNVTTFESYVATVSGATLATFGKDLFGDVPSTFAPSDVAQVNGEYLIGSGDELQIRGWGMVDIDITAKVDRSGAVYLPHVGAVKVAGVKYADLQGHLKKAVSRIYTNFELTASLSQVRTVQVYVVGHAVRPGTYTLSAMSTLLNALFTSGGPDQGGSMRNIQVKRGAATVTSFDLYDMLVSGDKSRDIALTDGDVIYIPEAGPLVALTGNVRNPAIFELKGPSSVADVVSWAGGFDAAAESRKVFIEKNIDNSYQTVAEIVADRDQVKARLAGVPVKAADVLRVFSPEAVAVQARVKNAYVRVSGEVNQTGVFALSRGETLRDLIVRLGGVTEDGYVYATQLTRESIKKSQQAKLNEVADRFERDLDAASSKRTALTDKDSAEILGAELERQRTQIKKLREVKATGRIVLEMSNGDAQVKNLPDVALQDGDTVHVPRHAGTVDVLGAVFQPNTFIFKPRRNVRDYVEMAGGVTGSADKSEMYVIRADGTADSGRNSGWLGGVSGSRISDGDTVVVPEEVARNSWTQKFKEWTTILYQFGLGAAGLKVLQN